MANKILDLVIKVKDEASKKLEEIKGSATGDGKGIAGLGDAFLSMAGTATMAAMAVNKVASEIGAQIDEFNDYVLGVNRLADAFDMTVQEAEKVTIAADVMGVSNDALFSSLNKLAREGMGTGIDALANLREEFQAIEDPAARATYLFGMAGEQGQKVLAPLLEMSQLEWDDFMAGMEGLSKIDEDMVANAEEMELATKELEAAWRNLTLYIVNFAAPGITQALNNITGSAGYMSEEVRLALEITGHDIGTFSMIAGQLGTDIETLAAQVSASSSRWTGYANHLKQVERQASATRMALLALSEEALPQMTKMGYDPYEGNIPGVTTTGPGKASVSSRRYYGGGGGSGGGIGNEDLEELFEDLIEVLEDLPKAIRDAVNRVD